MKNSENRSLFWKENPALLYSLSILIGTSAPLFFDHYFWPFFWLVYLLLSKHYAQIIVLGASLIYGFFYQITPPPSDEISAIFSPHSLAPHHSPFQKGLQYKGTLSYEAMALPCSICMRGNIEHRPLANKSYIVKGELKQKDAYDFIFKAHEWKPIEPSWSLAEMRFQIKEKFKSLISTHLPSGRVATFLSSISTGDVEDRMLRYEFGRLGLQHILAVSGFHFGILIAFLSFFFRFFLSHSWKILALFLMTSAYYVFVGASPAVERSYLTALFYLIAKWTHRPTSGLNLLGCAMGVELLFNPLVSNNIGFHLSFLSCFAILLFYPPIENKLRLLLPKRSRTEIGQLTLLSQHGYLFSSFFRKAISLTLAVNMALLPLLLFHFHQFPWLSLFYNIFFPFCTGISLVLLLSSFVFHLLFPPIASGLYWVTNAFTDFLLELTANPLFAIDYSLRISNVPSYFVILYCFVLGFWRMMMPKI